MTAATSLNIGLIGAGTNTRARHIPGFLKLKNVKLVAVANRTLESAKAVAKDLAIPRATGHWQDIIEDDNVDAICIGTWPYLHATATCAALAAGKHVLVEARMASDYNSALMMLEAAQNQPDCVAQIVPAPYSLDIDVTLSELLTSEVIGEVREVNFIHTEGGAIDSETPIHWRHQQCYSGHNTLSLGILHEIFLRWFDDDPEWVMADAAWATTERPGVGGDAPVLVDIPETLSVFGRFNYGARLTYHLSSLAATAPQFEAYIHGSEGSLRIDFARQQIYRASKAKLGAEQDIPIAAINRRGWCVEADFVTSIRESSPVRLTSFVNGARYMKFTDMVWYSWTHQGKRLYWRPPQDN